MNQEQGGLGLRPLQFANRALLNKWLWRFGVEKNPLWRRLIAAKYGKDHLGWTCRQPEGTIGCGVWKSISKGGVSVKGKTSFSGGSNSRSIMEKMLDFGMIRGAVESLLLPYSRTVTT